MEFVGGATGAFGGRAVASERSEEFIGVPCRGGLT